MRMGHELRWNELLINSMLENHYTVDFSLVSFVNDIHVCARKIAHKFRNSNRSALVARQHEMENGKPIIKSVWSVLELS